MEKVLEGKWEEAKDEINAITDMKDFLPPNPLKEDIIMAIKYLILMELDKLYKKALSIYSKSEASALIKAIVFIISS